VIGALALEVVFVHRGCGRALANIFSTIHGVDDRAREKNFFASRWGIRRVFSTVVRRSKKRIWKSFHERLTSVLADVQSTSRLMLSLTLFEVCVFAILG